jgi:hypothetical protein
MRLPTSSRHSSSFSIPPNLAPLLNLAISSAGALVENLCNSFLEPGSEENPLLWFAILQLCEFVFDFDLSLARKERRLPG